MKESEERFRAMSDTAPVLIWMDDPNAERVFLNRQWLDFTGRTLEQYRREGDGVERHHAVAAGGAQLVADLLELRIVP